MAYFDMKEPIYLQRLPLLYPEEFVRRSFEYLGFQTIKTTIMYICKYSKSISGYLIMDKNINPWRKLLSLAYLCHKVHKPFTDSFLGRNPFTCPSFRHSHNFEQYITYYIPNQQSFYYALIHF